MGALESLTGVVIVVMIVSTMFSIGLGLNLRQIKSVLSNYSLMARGLIVNFLVIPLVAFALTKIIPMDEVIAIGFLVASVCAGAPFGPKLAQIVKADVPFAVTMMVVLSGLTIIVTPIWLYVFLGPTTLSEASIDPLPLIGQIIVIYLLPMIIGLFINTKYPTMAQKFRPPTLKLSNVAFPIAIALIVITNISGLVSLFGSLGLITSIISVVIYGVLGYVFGGPKIGTRRSLVFDSAIRNGGLGILLAAQAFSNEPKVAVMVVVFGIIQTIVMLPIAALLGRRKPAELGEITQSPK
jgi:BASS family bile acid:Na+ symporter